MGLALHPIDFKDACEFVNKYHSHHHAPRGWKFGVAVDNGEKIVGVVMVGRPISPKFDDGFTLEVTRCCTDGTKNVASMLYGVAKRVAKELGYKRLITYILVEEQGTSLKAAGWKRLYVTRGGEWDRKYRPRVTSYPVGNKVLWEGFNISKEF